MGSVTTPTSFLAALWEGQEGLAELASPTYQRALMKKPAAIATASEFTFFAPLLRSEYGSTKAHVASSGNVVWADIDNREAPARIEALLVHDRSLVPTYVVDSGNKGYWVFLKLNRHVPTDVIEEINKGLSKLLSGDLNTWNRDRLSRIPGSINPNSGRTVEVVEATGVLHDPADLDNLRLAVTTTVPGNQDTTYAPQTRQFPMPKLRAGNWAYIRAQSRRGEGYDRSSMEFGIFKALVAQNFSDEEIIAFADFHQLPRHRQDRARLGDYRWTLASIAKARLALEQDPSSSLTSTMCTQGDHYHHADRLRALASIEGGTATETQRAISETEGCSRSTSQRILRQLGHAKLIRRERKGRQVIYQRTPRGDELVTRRFRPALFLPTVRSLAARDRRLRGH